MITLLVYSTAQDECNLPDYPRILDRNDTSMMYMISQYGVKKFIKDGMDNAMVFIDKFQIPDLEFSIKLVGI